MYSNKFLNWLAKFIIDLFIDYVALSEDKQIIGLSSMILPQILDTLENMLDNNFDHGSGYDLLKDQPLTIEERQCIHKIYHFLFKDTHDYLAVESDQSDEDITIIKWCPTLKDFYACLNHHVRLVDKDIEDPQVTVEELITFLDTPFFYGRFHFENKQVYESYGSKDVVLDTDPRFYIPLKHFNRKVRFEKMLLSTEDTYVTYRDLLIKYIELKSSKFDHWRELFSEIDVWVIPPSSDEEKQYQVLFDDVLGRSQLFDSHLSSLIYQYCKISTIYCVYDFDYGS